MKDLWTQREKENCCFELCASNELGQACAEASVVRAVGVGFEHEVADHWTAQEAKPTLGLRVESPCDAVRERQRLL